MDFNPGDKVRFWGGARCHALDPCQLCTGEVLAEPKSPNIMYSLTVQWDCQDEPRYCAPTEVYKVVLKA